jgi:hypothetical protein
MPRSSSWPLSFRLSYRTSVCSSHFLHAWGMASLPHAPFGPHNTSHSCECGDLSSGMRRRVVRYKSTDRSEKHTVCVLSVEEYAYYCCLLDLLFEPEDGGSMFLRNVDELQPDYMASYPVK